MKLQKLRRITLLALATCTLIGCQGDEPAEQPGQDSAPATSAKAAAPKRPALQPGQPKPYDGDLRSLALINVRDARLATVYRGLDYPWAMEFLTPDELLVTEIQGRMTRITISSGEAHPISGVPAVPTGKPQLGLLDVALDPDFDANHRVYFSHSVAGTGKEEGRYALGLSRAVLIDDELTQVERIFTGMPFGTSAANFGGAIAFDANGALYLGTGDRSVRDDAGSLATLNGKVIRITPEGDPVPGNPFMDRPDVDDRIYASGVRNPQGLIFDAPTGRLIETEHGPMGGDEVNVIRSGADYGWPKITYGANYTTQRIGVGTHYPGLEQPLYYYLPSLAISPIAIYRGAMFPEWEGHLLVGALKGNLISKLDVQDGAVLSEQRILDELKGRIRDIKVAADGSIYILNQSGTIHRLYRDPTDATAETPKERSGASVYHEACASCHSADLPGIPQLGDTAAWAPRVAQGHSVLLQHTIDGFNAMPERGFCEVCSDSELSAAVDYILSRLEQSK